MQVHSAARSAEPYGSDAFDTGGLSERRLLDGLTVRVSAEPGGEGLAAWDRLVAGTVNADVAQLSAWAAIRARVGYQPLYVLAWSQGTLLGGACLLRRRIRGLGWVAYLPYGPLLREGLAGLRASVRAELVAALTEVAGSHVALFVQPPDGGEDVSLELLRRGFRFSQAGIAPAATMRVDLRRSEDELRAGLNRRLRTWTRQWPGRGVKVRLGDERDIAVLARLAAGTASYQGFTPFPQDYLEATYAGLAAGGHAVLLIGELSGQPVAAELLTGCGGVLKSRVTGLDRDSAEASKFNVASAMIWEAMCWGRVNGYHHFDFGGLRPESVLALRAPGPTDLSALPGPDVFKTKFGGQVYTYPPAVELIRSRTLRAGYDLLRQGSGGTRLLDTVREALRGGH